MSKAIEASALVKHYPPDVEALAGLDISVEEGTIFALLGPNGAGKSTTVKILTTLTRARLRAGPRRRARRRSRDPSGCGGAIGVVGQKHGFDPEATGRENLELQGAHLRPAGPRAARGASPELLERFGLAGAAGRAAKTYSGGMQRRLDIAMGLIHRPARALPRRADDRPRSRGARRTCGGRSRGSRPSERMTILLTTHYLEEADELAADVAIVDRGRDRRRGHPRAS